MGHGSRGGEGWVRRTCDCRPDVPPGGRLSPPRRGAAPAPAPLGGLRPDGAGGRRHAGRPDPAARRAAAGPAGQPGHDRARHRADRAGGADGGGPGPGPTARAVQAPVRGAAGRRPGGCSRSPCRCASPRWRCSAGGPSGWRRPPPSCSGPCSPRPTRCSPRTSRWAGPGGIVRGRPRGGRDRRGPLRADLRGRAERRPRVPVRLRRDPARHRGRRLRVGAGVGGLLPRRQGAHRRARRPRRRLARWASWPSARATRPADGRDAATRCWPWPRW